MELTDLLKANHVLLHIPDFKRKKQYPPVGLMKLSSWLKYNYVSTELAVGYTYPVETPDYILIPTGFTWDWLEAWDAVAFFHKAFPKARIILGGIYASLMPEHAKKSGADYVHVGLFDEAEGFPPDYSLDEGGDRSYAFASRGCINKCEYCPVKDIEGKYRSRNSIAAQLDLRRPRVQMMDNNFIANPELDTLTREMSQLDKLYDINSGFDCMLITEENIEYVKRLRLHSINMAFDKLWQEKHLDRCYEIFENAGFHPSQISIFMLYNYEDTFEDFWYRLKTILIKWHWNCFPMKFQPLDTLYRDSYVGPNWSRSLLELIKAFFSDKWLYSGQIAKTREQFVLDFLGRTPDQFKVNLVRDYKERMKNDGAKIRDNMAE